MDDEEIRAFRASLEAIGEPSVRAKRKANAWGFGTARSRQVDKWLAEQELAREADAAGIARRAAEAAETAATAAKKSERFAWIAICVSLLSIGVTIILWYYGR